MDWRGHGTGPELLTNIDGQKRTSDQRIRFVWIPREGFRIIARQAIQIEIIIVGCDTGAGIAEYAKKAYDIYESVADTCFWLHLM